MKYIPGLPNNPPTHLVEYFHNKALVEDVKKQLNFIIGSLLNSLQNKAASLQPVSLFMDQMVNENFSGPITIDYLSKGIDYANYCVATKDLNNIRQGWPRLSDDLSVGMSAAFLMNNESMLSQIPEALRPMIQNSAMSMANDITAAINFSNNGSINMYQQQQFPMQGMMPQQGVQQFPANGMQQFMQQPMQMVTQQPQQFGFQQQNPMMAMQQPQINPQQIMMIIQQNPQLMMMYQQNPQMAMQQAQMMMMQQMQNPYMQRANTINPMGQQQQMIPQAPVNGFINNQQFGTVPQQQVGTARASSFSKASANTAPQQVQLGNQQQSNNGMIMPNQQNPQFQAQTQQHFQPQPTAQQPSAQQQVVSATVHHGGNAQPVNMTQQVQPINNPGTMPQHSHIPTIPAIQGYSNLAADTSVIDPTIVAEERAVANDSMVYDITGRRISRIYSRDCEIVKVTQDNNGIVVEDSVEVAKVKYEEHESQRILPSRTNAEKRALGSTKRMNEVLEMAASEVDYQEVLEKIRKDQTEAGEELVDLDVSRILTELGTNAVRLTKPTFALNKASILPILDVILEKNKIPVDTATRSVITDFVVGGPLSISETLASEIDKLNSTENLADYIFQLETISRLDIPNLHWSWVHDEVLKEINNFIEKYYGLSITIDSVLMDLDDLITYVGNNYDNELSTQMYMTLHLMLKSTVLQVFRRDQWPDIVDEGQILVGKIYRVVTLPIVSCQVPYNAPGKSGIIDRNTHTQLVKLLDSMMKWREDYHSMLLITVDNDIIEVNTTTIDGNYIMYCGNE